MIRIVINADDFGLSDGICKSIIELLDMGAISNTTIMVAAPEATARLRQFNVSSLLGAAGLHLQLTGGKPISPSSEVKSLIDPYTGRFLDRNAMKHANPEEVEQEWLRQIELVTDLLGGPPTHLDSHHGAHRIPHLGEIYLSLATKFKLPVRGVSDNNFIRKLKARKIRGSHVLLRNWTGAFLSELELLTMLKQLSEGLDDDLIEIVTHPGYCDVYLEEISSLNKARDNDHNALSALKHKNLLEENGFVRVSYPSLSNH